MLMLVVVGLVETLVGLKEVLDVDAALDDVEDEDVDAVTVLWMKKAMREAVPELAPLSASPG